MWRHRWSLVFWTTALLLAWHYGLLRKLDPVVHTGFSAMMGRTTIDFAESAQRSTIRSNLDRALGKYRKANEGQDPPSLQALVEAGYLWSSDLQDEWGRPLLSEVRGGRLVVTGMGRDGKLGTADDWTLGE